LRVYFGSENKQEKEERDGFHGYNVQPKLCRLRGI
jgi:hypothetical protein